MKTRKSLMTLAFAAVVAAVMTACTVNSDNPTPAQANLPTKFELTGNEVAYAGRTNEFAFNMFRIMADKYQQASLVTSPLSVACALGMLNNGAVGQTQQELLHVLGLDNADAQEVNEYFYKLMVLAPQVDNSTVLRMANAIYVNGIYSVQSQFANALNLYYQAEANSLDFADSQTVNVINEWCAHQTNNMIPKMFSEIPSDAVSIMLNALYFKGLWQHPFDAKYTQDGDFITEDGKKMRRPMMCMTSEENEYYKTTDFQALRMGYGNGRYSMTILLPSEGLSVSDLARKLTPDTWGKIQDGLHKPDELFISVPRFTVETSDKQIEDLSDILKQMGVVGIFERDGDLPNVIMRYSVLVSKVSQKAKIEVNEEGAEGSAVSGLEVLATDNGDDSGGMAAFNANRPFVYVISERTTGLVFFIGAYHGEK